MNSNLDCSRSSLPETTCGHYCVSPVFSHFLICQMPTELSKLNLIHMPLRERERATDQKAQGFCFSFIIINQQRAPKLFTWPNNQSDIIVTSKLITLLPITSKNKETKTTRAGDQHANHCSHKPSLGIFHVSTLHVWLTWRVYFCMCRPLDMSFTAQFD